MRRVRRWSSITQSKRIDWSENEEVNYEAVLTKTVDLGLELVQFDLEKGRI